jgi:formate hydrogenlyase subunit 3/multisubunit Na+/H+ antiporter MnhD subunit
MTEASASLPAFSLLPAVALGLPLLGAVAVVRAGERRARERNLAAVFTSGATLAVVLALLVKVLDKGPVYFALELLKVGDRFILNLQVDALGAFFGFFASLLWFAASLHSYSYMSHEHKRTRFYLFMSLVETATLGVFFVQDYFSLYVFFEAMGLLAFMLVIHSETEKARRAATKYLYMTIFGGLSLMMGIYLYYYYSGTLGFIPPAESSYVAGSFKVLALVFLMVGFGVKAGMVPLHIWLPDAHPAAPSPASALLSGVMIKAGAYGIIRMVTSFFYHPLGPGGGEAAPGEATAHAAGAAAKAGGLAINVQTLGFAIVWIGIATMFIGMILALVQDDIKRTLAYSSVSQMGYILMGTGCLAFLGVEGSMGIGGSLYHILNHAFFKGCFFLAAGSLLFCTHELNMYKLGGLWRKMPVTCACWCIAALGIMGIPLAGGFVSKTLLHHAIVESHHLAEHSHLWSAGWVKMAEIFFIVTSGGTIAYNLKMAYYIFFRKPREESQRLEHVKEAPAWMLAGTVLLAVGVVFNGLFPGVILKKMLVPVAGTFTALEHQGVEHLGELSIFSWANIKDVLVPLAIGLAVFLYGARRELFKLEKIRFDPFRLRLPRWLGVDFYYVEGAKGFISFCWAGQRVYNRFEEGLVRKVSRGVRGLNYFLQEELIPAVWYGPLNRTKELTLTAYNISREKLMPVLREYQGDIALGALVIAISLTLFLIMKLL